MKGDSIGVFLCSWGSGKEPRLDIEALRSYAEQIEGVSLARIVHRICSEEGQREMASAIKEAGIDRFVAVACSPRTKTDLYPFIAGLAGLHPLAFEVANIREQAAYVHAPRQAQEKAERLISMAVERARLWSQPPFEDERPVSREVMVIGDGLMAALVAKDLASQGLKAHVILSVEEPGMPPDYIFSDESQKRLASDLISGLSLDPLIQIHLDTRVEECTGVPGEFNVILSRSGEQYGLSCGALILAPEPRAELRRLDGSPAPRAEDLLPLGIRKVAILPSGTSSGVGCSCITPRGILYSLSIKAIAPDSHVLLLGREVRALGGFEENQRRAQEEGVVFARLEQEPAVRGEGPWRVLYTDPDIGDCSFVADLVLLDSIQTPEVHDLAKVLRLPIDEKGELLSLESRLRPGETVRKGMFVARYRVGNMLFQDMVLEAGTAAARAMEMVGWGSMRVGGGVAEVDPEKCSACLACVRICPYGAPHIGQAGKAEVQLELCQGCGACIPLCPSRALDIYLCSNAQLVAQERAALRGAR